MDFWDSLKSVRLLNAKKMSNFNSLNYVCSFNLLKCCGLWIQHFFSCLYKLLNFTLWCATLLFTVASIIYHISSTMFCIAIDEQMK